MTDKAAWERLIEETRAISADRDARATASAGGELLRKAADELEQKHRPPSERSYMVYVAGSELAPQLCIPMAEWFRSAEADAGPIGADHHAVALARAILGEQP